jgi:hypothetical protein
MKFVTSYVNVTNIDVFDRVIFTDNTDCATRVMFHRDVFSISVTYFLKYLAGKPDTRVMKTHEISKTSDFMVLRLNHLGALFMLLIFGHFVCAIDFLSVKIRFFIS